MTRSVTSLSQPPQASVKNVPNSRTEIESVMKDQNIEDNAEHDRQNREILFARDGTASK